MGRKFGSHHLPEPENEYVTGSEDHPTEGTPDKGIPAFPAPLPGTLRYPVKPATISQRLDVPPPKPYYAGGMAHGVHQPGTHHDDQIMEELKHFFRELFRGEPHHDEPQGSSHMPAIPVYITEEGAGVHPLSRASFRQVTVQLNADPVVIIDRNRSRSRASVLVESPPPASPATGPGGIRLLDSLSGTGSLIPAGQSKYVTLYTQDQVYAVADSTATGPQILSIIEEYKVSG